jgi:predicted Zn finger-like uncharacterized protein
MSDHPTPPTPPAPSPQTFTRCPGCATVFRVSAAQLALREGQVRCGHCRAVFDANDQRVSLDARQDDDGALHDELLAGRPTVTLRGADALQPVAAPAPRPAPDDVEASKPTAAQSPGPVPEDVEAAKPPPTQALATAPDDANALEPVGGQSPGPARGDAEAPQPAAAQTPGPVRDDANQTQADAAVEPDAGSAATGDTAVEAAIAGDAAHAAQSLPEPPADGAPIEVEPGLRPARAEWKPRKSLRERPRLLHAAAVVLLLVLLGAQALFEYRDALAAHAPFTRPILAALCAPIGCSVGPLRDAGALSIDASDLRADPGHRGLLELSATIRNRAPYAIAWPYLELTLTDASDHVVVRRAFEPGDYAPADMRQGIAGNGEQVVRLFLDASATSQAGYRVYLFYP